MAAPDGCPRPAVPHKMQNGSRLRMVDYQDVRFGDKSVKQPGNGSVIPDIRFLFGGSQFPLPTLEKIMHFFS